MRRTYGMQLTIDKYTQMVAPLDVRDLDLANAFHTHRLTHRLGLVAKARASMTGEFFDHGRERLDIVGAHDHVGEAPTFSAA